MITIKDTYYSKFNKTEFRKVTQYLNESLARWMRRKFKSLGDCQARFREKGG